MKQLEDLEMHDFEKAQVIHEAKEIEDQRLEDQDNA